MCKFGARSHSKGRKCSLVSATLRAALCVTRTDAHWDVVRAALFLPPPLLGTAGIIKWTVAVIGRCCSASEGHENRIVFKTFKSEDKGKSEH